MLVEGVHVEGVRVGLHYLQCVGQRQEVSPEVGSVELLVGSRLQTFQFQY